jgi:hypothetical protein
MSNGEHRPLTSAIREGNARETDRQHRPCRGFRDGRRCYRWKWWNFVGAQYTQIKIKLRAGLPTEVGHTTRVDVHTRDAVACPVYAENILIQRIWARHKLGNNCCVNASDIQKGNRKRR